MKKVVLIAPSQPGRSPRLVRNANALALSGCDVTVVTPVFEADKIEIDQQITRNASWKYLGVPLFGKMGERLNLRCRVIKKAALAATKIIPFPGAGSRALMYGSVSLLNAARRIRADVYVAQQQASIPLVAALAKERSRPFCCDIEDILSESIVEPCRLIRAIEKRYLKEARYIFTMSDAAKDYLQDHYRVGDKTFVLHNTPSLKERDSLQPPNYRKAAEKPSIYWFGQTFGPHSCALELMRANAQAGFPFNLRFRGNPVADYVKILKKLEILHPSPDYFKILPYASPDLMVKEAAEYDVLFGSQPSNDLFHQLAIGNKVFTGMAAGCALLLSDTIAHRRLNTQTGNAAILVNHREIEKFSCILSRLGAERAQLEKLKRQSWDLASHKYNWETEGAIPVELLKNLR